MPEGDTIHRSARTLRAALAGRRVTAVRAAARQLRGVGIDRLVGQTVHDVEARGKHLLHWFAPSELALHSHMGMTGSWHVYRPGERWRKPTHLARVVLEVPDVVAVCFTAPVCELLSARQVAAHPSLLRLGPDALEPHPDLGEARARLDARADQEIGVALLDQGVLAGVGNVYRNEVLFLHGVDPWARVRDVPPELREALLGAAERLLKANAAPGAGVRTTTGAGRGGGARTHVYGRGGRPCPRCGTAVAVGRQGGQARLTYWCPRCQGPGRPLPDRVTTH